jgi:DNA polymerase-3 subunit gamma/tau
VFTLLEKMSTGEVKSVFALVQELAETTPDYTHTLDGLLSVLHRVALAQVVPEAIDNSLGDKAQLQALAAALTPEDVQLFYQMGIRGRDDLRYSADSRSAFEMLLMRMMVFSPNYVHVQQAEPDTISTKTTPEVEKKKSETAVIPVAISPPEPEKPPIKKPAPPALQVPAPGKRELGQSEDKSPSLSQLTHAQWLEIYQAIKLGGIVGNVLANSELIKVEGSTLHFVLDQSQSAVFNNELVPKLEQALANYFKTEVSVVIASGEVNCETAAMRGQRLKQERHLEMVSEFEQDENVQELVRHFSGTIAKDSIAPVKDRGNE